MKKGVPIMIQATLSSEGLTTYVDALVRQEEPLHVNNYNYIPALVVGTFKISKEQKLHLAFTGYVLSKLQKKTPESGTIFAAGNKAHKIRMEPYIKEVEQIHRKLTSWICEAKLEPPPIILNKHCHYCPFHVECEIKAKEQDHLSLLDGISTSRQIKKYEKKGIFTVNQLSYLYRPRRKRKRSRNPPALRHSSELQALVIRIGKIYLFELPRLVQGQTELFLDIEGIPDQQCFYLIGLLICDGSTVRRFSFWADTKEDEAKIWYQLVTLLDMYPDCPIYHYGNYEAAAITTLGKRYGTLTDKMSERLVNVNTYIYGKVYFPLRSNGLKDIGKYIGASWTSPDASGLQTLVWRYRWENTRNSEYKQRLQLYNHEDCLAVKRLTDFLCLVKEKDDSILDIDCFVSTKKDRNSKVKNPLHHQLESILRFAHMTDYHKKKIRFSDLQNRETDIQLPIKPEKAKSRKKYHRITRTVQVPPQRLCPKCGEILEETKKKVKRVQIDLVFSKNGVRKSVINRVFTMSRCKNCNKSYNSNRTLGRPEKYGNGFKIWMAYQRVSHRLSYENIKTMIRDLFNEEFSDKLVILYLNEVARHYSSTEEKITQNLLNSPYLHVDETQINVDFVNQYIWVITDGIHVVFKHTETREASFVQDFLSDYTGILISDFYPGFDALKCKHQKCLVHLIRDLNNDLWTAPFDHEYAKFVSDFKDLIVPIMAAIQMYGLKKRHLHKFKKRVDMYYARTITNHAYQSDLCSKFQERFTNYRDSLFTFLDHNGILWHNNPAERALRHIILQSNVSRVYHKTVIEDYLILLGIKQTCRFQNKSFFR
ncbi:MAG: TM0106 family RecB-like putative nuclease, partial [Candidatus Bathyarchaeota archaeon]